MIIKYYAMQTISKYAMMVNKYARMMVVMINDIFGFFMMNARCKSVFVFSDLIMAANKSGDKIVGKVFLMIKNGPGFMVSQMHSLLITW